MVLRFLVLVGISRQDLGPEVVNCCHLSFFSSLLFFGGGWVRCAVGCAGDGGGVRGKKLFCRKTYDHLCSEDYLFLFRLRL